MSGAYTEHSLYGQQFKVEEYEIRAPKDAAAIERYLGSGAVKGIGTALAARIVRRFGDDTMRIMEEEPERLAEIRGISEKKGAGDCGTVGRKNRASQCDALSFEVRNLHFFRCENI